jgi:hypothetical protein
MLMVNSDGKKKTTYPTRKPGQERPIELQIMRDATKLAPIINAL